MRSSNDLSVAFFELEKSRTNGVVSNSVSIG